MDKFERWTVIADAGSTKAGDRRSLCRCDCGVERVVLMKNLRNGISKSCGCLKHELNRARKSNLKHGKRNTRTYAIWCNMKARCTNRERPQWRDYGGRGITYDPRWERFENFMADMGESPERMSIDRIDNDGDYCKQNCRWADTYTQRRNRPDVYRIVDDGEVLCLKDLCDKRGISSQMVYSRISNGWSLPSALSTPPLRLG